MKFPWYVTALGAAVVWGVHYPLLDHALKRLSLYTVLFLTVIPMLLVALPKMAWSTRAAIVLIPFTSLVGAVLMFLAISDKNATLASLIEISYPVFVALFAWLLFRQIHLNTSVLVGASLVFAGVAAIILNNPH